MLEVGKIYPVEQVELIVSDAPHPYHVANYKEALDNWSKEVERKPELFNGDILLQHNIVIEDNVLRASCHVAPYSTLLHWLRGSRDDLIHLFAIGLIVSGDGLPIMGRMAPHTYNAGHVYAPSGSLDRGDILNSKIDLDRNIARELMEETALDCEQANKEHQFQVFVDKNVVIAAKRYYFDETAELLCAGINQFIADDPDAELSEVFAIGENGAYDDRMPSYMPLVLDWHFDK